jgi:hypothetical protein
MFWPSALLALILRRRLRIRMPLCNTHEYYWVRQKAVTIVSFGVLFAGLCYFIQALDNANHLGLPVGWLQLWIAGPTWLAIALLMRTKAIRPIEITEDTITLTGVSAQFVDAVRAERKVWRRN